MAIDSAKFLGLTKKSSQDLAERNNVIFRLIRIDDESFMSYPEESDNRSEKKDRICVEIDSGKVTKATYQ